jgi:hypothetical protein
MNRVKRDHVRLVGRWLLVLICLEKYCCLVAGGWFVLGEKYCWLVAEKPGQWIPYRFSPI